MNTKTVFLIALTFFASSQLGAQQNIDTSKLNIAGPANADTTRLLSANQKTGYEHMMFSMPPSTNRSSYNWLNGFIFSYYNPAVSQTFSEVDRVLGDKRKFDSKDDFDKYVSRQTSQVKKGFKKSETIRLFMQDTLVSAADFISSLYFVTEDSDPAIAVNGVHPTLEVRAYHAWLYKKDSTTGKGNVYAIFFSERGLPGELHSQQELKWKIQQFLNSCEFISSK